MFFLLLTPRVGKKTQKHRHFHVISAKDVEVQGFGTCPQNEDILRPRPLKLYALVP